MSKKDSWSTEDAAEAERWGWALCDVYDLSKKRLTRQLLPAKFGDKASAAAASKFVVARAQAGDALARKAVNLVMQGMK
jgi:hypothetical protein